MCVDLAVVLGVCAGCRLHMAVCDPMASEQVPQQPQHDDQAAKPINRQPAACVHASLVSCCSPGAWPPVLLRCMQHVATYACSSLEVLESSHM